MRRALCSDEAPLPVARKVWRRADAVCFDVDSTVIQEEGLDGLAEFLHKGEEVRAMYVTLHFSLPVYTIINPLLPCIQLL